MQITFLKNHLAYKQGDSIEVADATAFYLIRCGVAEAYEPIEKKEIKSKREKKEISKPGAE